MTSNRVVKLAVSLVCMLVALAHVEPMASAQSHSADSSDQSCLEAAKKALGPEAEVAKCGHLTGTAVLETVAVIRLKQFPGTAEGGIAVSKLVVLRQDKPHWDVELSVDRRATRNQVGYIAMDFIDDSRQSQRAYAGYYVWYSRYTDMAEKIPGFAIVLSNLRWDRDEEAEGTSWEIAWNPSVGRLQEYTENDDLPGFRPEKKNLPRLSEIQKLHGCGGPEKPPCVK